MRGGALFFILAVVSDAHLLRGKQGETTRASNDKFAQIVTYLKDMKDSLKAECKADEAVNDKMKCWCQTGAKSYAKDLAANAAATTEAEGEETKQKSHAGKLASEIEQIKTGEGTGIADITAKIDDLKNVFSSDYNAKEQKYEEARDMAQQVKAAVEALKKHTHSTVGEVKGMLSTMLKSFTETRDTLKAELAQSLKLHEAALAAKVEERQLQYEALHKKETEKAECDVKGTALVAELAALEAEASTLSAALGDMNIECSDHDEEYAARMKDRDEALEAVTQALSIVTGGDLWAVRSGLPSSFLQEHSTKGSAALASASKVLLATGQKHSNAAITALALKLNPANFKVQMGSVKQQILNLVDKLEKEKSMEGTLYEQCKSIEFMLQANTADGQQGEETIEQQLELKENAVAGLEAQLKDEKALEASLIAERDAAIETRYEAKKAYDDQLANANAAKTLLEEAVDILELKYGFAPAEVAAKVDLLQEQPDFTMVTGETVAHQSFEAVDPKRKTKGHYVVTLFKSLIADIAKAKTTAEDAELKAVNDHGTWLTAQASAITDSVNAQTGINDSLITKKGEVAAMKAALSALSGEIEGLQNTENDRANTCSFVVENYMARQEAFQEEINSLNSATVFLTNYEES